MESRKIRSSGFTPVDILEASLEYTSPYLQTNIKLVRNVSCNGVVLTTVGKREWGGGEEEGEEVGEGKWGGGGRELVSSQLQW